MSRRSDYCLGGGRKFVPNSENDTASSIIDILCEAEGLVDQADYAVTMEPTPLGPRGVAKVVKNLTMSDASWITGDINITNLLVPLLLSSKKRRALTRTAAEGDELPALWASSGVQQSLKKRRLLHVDISEAKTLAHSASSIESPENWDDSPESKERFRAYQAEQWNERFCGLQAFRMSKGHCLVPHSLPENHVLSQWVKTQRYQYKLKQGWKRSTLTDERQGKLEALGFIWDSHRAVWEEKFKDLCLFREKHGHSNVPSKFHDKSLAIWVKCQRRHNKLFLKGQKSAMNVERVEKIGLIDFIWNPRNL
jgi:hypothetical protein